MDDPYIGELMPVAFDFAPKFWAFCNGQQLAIAQNQALFAILGTTYGGNGVTTFALPNLQGRVPIGFGSGIYGNFVLGQVGGEQNHTLISTEMPQHTHQARADGTTAASSNANVATTGVSSMGNSTGAGPNNTTFTENVYDTATPGVALSPGTITNAGGSQPHNNLQPYTVINWCICLSGIFPSRN